MKNKLSKILMSFIALAVFPAVSQATTVTYEFGGLLDIFLTSNTGGQSYKYTFDLDNSNVTAVLDKNADTLDIAGTISGDFHTINAQGQIQGFVAGANGNLDFSYTGVSHDVDPATGNAVDAIGRTGSAGGGTFNITTNSGRIDNFNVMGKFADITSASPQVLQTAYAEFVDTGEFLFALSNLAYYNNQKAFENWIFNADYQGFTVTGDFHALVRNTTTAVPEPSTFGMLGLGLLGMGLIRRKRLAE